MTLGITGEHVEGERRNGSHVKAVNAYQLVLRNETDQKVRTVVLYRDIRTDKLWWAGG
jgi:hypothetical protein